MEPIPAYKPKNKMNDEPQWFAMRATYRSEIDMKEKLELAGLKCFVPMKIEKKVMRGRIVRTQVPAIHSLLFVFGKQCSIQEFKISHPRLQYIVKRSHTELSREPLTIPTPQMESFIALCTSDKSLILPVESNFKPGMRVRITQGPFEGLEGTFQRISGYRDRRFVISLTGVAIVSTTEVDASMIEALD